jgi:hypothetical protein
VRFELSAADPDQADLFAVLVLRAGSAKLKFAADHFAPGGSLDGLPFVFDRLRHTRSWVASKWAGGAGVVHVDFVSAELFYKEHHRLNMALRRDRDLLWRLVETMLQSGPPAPPTAQQQREREAAAQEAAARAVRARAAAEAAAEAVGEEAEEAHTWAEAHPLPRHQVRGALTAL